MTWRCDGCGRDWCEAHQRCPCPYGFVAYWEENDDDSFLTRYDEFVRVRHAGGRRR